MHFSIPIPLEAWSNFYVIVGSSAGALTGLQFVVMTLITQGAPTRSRGEAISAFGTPNVVHFCGVLLISAILSMPWSSARPVGLAVAGCGVSGVIYSLIVVRRAHRQDAYRPVFEDWLWHTILPTLSYLLVLVAGLALSGRATGALYVIGSAALLLIFVGIHNAWDTVTYVTMGQGASGPGDPLPPAVMAPPAPAPTATRTSHPSPAAASAGGTIPAPKPPRHSDG